MNSDSSKTPREEMETWLTSLLLGELSEGEAAAVHALIKHDPELARLHDDLKSTIRLVREATVSAPEPTKAAEDQPKLSAERREKLLAQFKAVAPKEFAPEKRRAGIRLLELAAVLAILALLAAMLLPSLAKSKSKAQSIAVLSNLRQLEVAKQLWAEENNKTANDAPTLGDLKPYLGRGEMPSVAGETYVLGAVGEPPAAEVAAADAKKTFQRWTANLPSDGRNDRVRLFADGKAYSFDSSQLSTKEVSGRKPADNQLTTVTLGGISSSAAKGPANEPAQNLSYYGGLSGGARENSVSVPAASTPPPTTPIVLPTTSGMDSLNPASQNYAVTASAANRAYFDGTVRAGSVLLETLSSGTPPPTLGSGVSAEPAPLVDPSTGLPVAAVVTGDATPKLETREFSVNSEALHRAVETVTGPDEAFRRRYSDSGLLTIPRVSVVVGQAQGGGGGGGGGAGATPTEPSFTPPAVSETAPNSAGYLSDAAGLNLKTDEGKSVSLGGGAVQTRGITLDGVDKSDTANRARTPAETPVADSYYLPLSKAEPLSSVTATNSLSLTDQQEFASGQSRFGSYAGKPPVAGDALILGRRFTNSTDANGQLGYVVAMAESLDRPAKERGRVEELKNLTKPDLRRTLAEFSDDSELRETSLGLKVAEDRLATLQKDSTVLATDVEQAQKQVTELKKKAELANADANNAQVYLRKKREMEDMVDFQRLLTRKMNLEAIDEHLPKSSQVKILERAEAKNQPSQSFWGGIRNAVSGDVERAARIKVEKSDIAELGTASPRDSNPYDPRYVQSEFEIIRSETVLGRVVDQLGLGKGSDGKPNKSEAIAELRKRLDLQAMPNSTVVEIRAKADKPEEAAQIANTVAEVYKQWRLDKGNELVKGGLASLEERSRQQEEKLLKAKVELAQLGESLGISDAEATKGIAADLPVRTPSTNAPIPQPEIQTSENNFSTFSLNVSDVSFKLAAASLEKGQMPDVATVRSEEFINAFDYRDPEPAAGAPIAFAWERARYPFAHNRDLLRFSLKTAAAGRQAGRPLNVVLLLDNSGSMERADRVQIIREALHVLASQLQPQDKLSVITFARTARLVADGISGDKAGEVAEQVSGLTPQGGTNLEDAMNLAYQTAARHYLANGINRVVLLTDGAANLGDVEPESLEQKVEAQRKQGIALDCFGIGWDGFNDDLLEVLSRNGDGRYGFINSPEEAATEFVGQLAGALQVAASDVKVQVEFNPKRVMTYRQIGYAKHQLTKEQFRDNTVDAAEIAAQEAGNALYTVEVNPAREGPIATVRVRYKVPGTTDYREQAWDVPFNGNALSLEQSSPAMRLATSASAFSEWLVASPFAGEVTPDALLSYLSGVPKIYGADARPTKLEWMIRQAKSLEGK